MNRVGRTERAARCARLSRLSTTTWVLGNWARGQSFAQMPTPCHSSSAPSSGSQSYPAKDFGGVLVARRLVRFWPLTDIPIEAPNVRFQGKADMAPERILSFLFQQFRPEVVHFTQQTSHWAVGITAQDGPPLSFKFAIGFCLRPSAIHQALEFVQKCPWVFPHLVFPFGRPAPT